MREVALHVDLGLYEAHSWLAGNAAAFHEDSRDSTLVCVGRRKLVLDTPNWARIRCVMQGVVPPCSLVG